MVRDIDMKNYLLVLGFFTMLLFLAGCNSKEKAVETETEETTYFSGTWITSVASTALDSRENIKKAVEVCADYGINHIFVVVWNKGRTHYPSKVMKELIGIEIAEQYVGRDPLQEMIEEAHAKGIKVHAWFEYGFAASNNQKGGLILEKKPEWAAKDCVGKLLTKNGFEWMNAFHPEVQDFMLSLVLEVVNGYEVDGVQGDDRLPALPSTGGYDEYTRNLYKQEHAGMEPPKDYKNADWVNWRADRLTDFLGRLYTAVKAVKPEVMVTTAPSIHPWAKDEYLQDWPAWLENGYTDMVIPQHYRYDIDAYRSVLLQQLSYLSGKNRRKFYPGVLIQNGSYNPSLEYLTQMVETNRANGVEGECFWFYEGILKFPEYFSNYRKLNK